MKGSRQGFTAVEFLVGLIVTGLFTIVSIPLFTTTLQSLRLNGAARKIAGDLRYAQSLAVAKGGLYRFHSGYDPAAGSPGQYRLEQSTDGGTTWSGVTSWYTLSSDFQGVSFSSAKDSSASPVTVYEVRFNSLGSCANCPGLTAPIVIAASSSSGTRTVQVRSAGSVNTP